MGIEADGLVVERQGGVLRLLLDNPRRKNALTAAMLTGLNQNLEAAATDEDLRVVVLSAVGVDFCTGMDLVEANQPREGRPRMGNHQRRIEQGANRLARTLSSLPIPVVSAVRGWAAGIGCPLALYGDYVVASETARFWTPFVRRGFTPDSGSTWLLPRLVGVQRAKQMLLLGRVIDAPTAGQWGLVSEVVADGDFDAAVEAVVAEFASAATVSVGLARQLINRGLELDLAHALTAEAAAEEVSLRSADFKEGIAAMRERREADFSGR